VRVERDLDAFHVGRGKDILDGRTAGADMRGEPVDLGDHDQARSSGHHGLGEVQARSARSL